jgi:hypothetical protein
MSSTINASSAGIVETADSSGTLQLQTGGQSALYIDASQNITVPKNLTVQGTLTFSGGGGGAVTTVSGGSTGLTPSTPASGNVVLAGTLLYSSGGTGLTSTGASGNVLVSTGSGWTSSSLTTAGIAPATGSSVYAPIASPTFTGTVSGTTASFSTQISSPNVYVNGTSFGVQYDSGITSTDIITSFGGNAKFTSTGSNYQGNNNASWATTSDRLVKTNITPITGSLEKINALKPSSFSYKNNTGIINTGFIAQDFETVFPELVHDQAVPSNLIEFVPAGTSTIKGITQDLNAFLVQAIQELSAKVTALEAKVGA